MKCPSCNKFAGLESQDPEVDEEFDAESGQVTASARLVRNSSCCGDEMKEASFEFEEAMPEEIVQAHQGEGHELEADFSSEAIEEGGGRYAKSYFGVQIDVTVRCSCQKQEDDPLWNHQFSDKVSASEMEELN